MNTISKISKLRNSLFDVQVYAEELYNKTLTQHHAIGLALDTISEGETLIRYLVSKVGPEIETNVMYLSLAKKLKKSNNKLQSYLTNNVEYVIIEEEDDSD